MSIIIIIDSIIDSIIITIIIIIIIMDFREYKTLVMAPEGLPEWSPT